MTKQEWVQVRVTTTEKQQLQALAANHGVSMSRYVKDQVFGATMIDPALIEIRKLPARRTETCEHRVRADRHCKHCD